jgi:ubiquitin
MAKPLPSSKVKGLFGPSEQSPLKDVDPASSPTPNSKNTRKIVIGVAALIGLFSCCGIAGVIGKNASKNGEPKSSSVESPSEPQNVKKEQTDYERGFAIGKQHGEKWSDDFNGKKEEMKNNKSGWYAVQKVLLDAIKHDDAEYTRMYKELTQNNSKSAIDFYKGRMEGYRNAIKKGIGLSLP